MAGHYARFEYKKTYAHLSESRIRQVFGDFVDFMPNYVRGRKKGLLKATMIEKVCIYGGAMRNGDIARPGDIPQIWLFPQDVGWEIFNQDDVDRLTKKFTAKATWLYSGSLGVQAHLPSGAVQYATPPVW